MVVNVSPRRFLSFDLTRNLSSNEFASSGGRRGFIGALGGERYGRDEEVERCGCVRRGPLRRGGPRVAHMQLRRKGTRRPGVQSISSVNSWRLSG